MASFFQRKISWLVRSLPTDILVVMVVLGTGAGILFWRVFLLEEVILPGDIPYSTPLWWGEAPDTRYYTAQNPLISDQIGLYYAWHRIAAHSMQTTGRIPLWNPYEFAGQPLLANMQSALLYPPNLLLFWLSPGKVATVRAFFKIFLAGIGTFLFCRSLRISRRGALLATIGFAFSGPVMAWLGFSHGNVLVSLPLLMWSGENLVSRKNPFLWGGISSIGVGLSIVGGHPETTFHVLLIWSCYVFLRLMWSNHLSHSRKFLASIFVIAIMLGFLVGSIQLLPFMDLLMHSSTFGQGRGLGGGWSLYAAEWGSNTAALITLVYPNFFGNPVTRNYLLPSWMSGNYNEHAMYFGLIPLMFAVGAMVASRKPKALWIIAILTLFCIGIALRLPGFELMNHFPIFSKVNNSRLRMIIAFLGSILAGFGYDAWKAALIHERTSRSRIFSGLVVIPVLAMLIFLGVSLGKTVILVREFAAPPSDALPMTFSKYLLFNIFAWDQSRTMITVAVTLILLGGYLMSRRRTIAPPACEYGLIALTFIELVVVAWHYNPTIPDEHILPIPPVLQLLQQDNQPFRLIETEATFLQNYPGVYQLFHLGGCDLPVFERYSDLYLAQGGQTDYAHTWKPDWPLIDLLNVKYLFHTEPHPFEKFHLWQDGWNVKISENPNVFPRAYMIYQVDVIADKAVLLHRMLGATYDFKQRVLLEHPLPAQVMEAISARGDGEQNFRVTIPRYGTDHVDLEVFTESPGMLFMSDLFAPGWNASLDGQPVEVYRANYTFRAVFVPAGTHHVRFVYRPLSFRVGVICSLLGLTCVLAGCLVGACRHKK